MNINCLFGDSRLTIFIIVLSVMSGCASAPKLTQIPNGETVSIVVAASPIADGQTELRNDAVGKDMGIGAGGGAVGGGLYGLTCGPWAPLCVPFLFVVGGITGGAAGAVVSTGASLSAEEATQLRDRMLRLNESHDKLAELTTNINDRAERYWDLSSTEPQTTVWVGVQNLKLASTHDNQVRAILQVSVMVMKKSDKPLKKVPEVWDYEYASPYTSLDIWLDDESDFADASISSAIRQISSDIVSDLAISSDTGETVQIAKVRPQSSSNGTSSVFESYGEAVAEVNNNTYDKNLWAKALVETGGDQTKRKARYIELRADQLYSEKVGPVSDASLSQQAAPVTPDTPIDISGTYRSDIIGSGSWSLGRFPNIEVILKQNKGEISGTFSGTRSGEIEGILNGDTIKFKWFVTAGRTESGRGEWKLPNDGITWNGTWRSSRGSQGNWNLTKIE
jgi:hypothetical protein